MTAWADFIQEGSYKGVRFDFVDTREAHSNELDAQEFPARDGARILKRARKALRLTVMAVFIEDDYPSQMWALSDALDDGTPGELIHPIHGTIQAACETHEVTHSAEDPDSATITITFVEHTESTALVFQNRPSIAAKASQARSDAADTTTASNNYVADTLSQLEDVASMAVALGSTAYAAVYNTAQLCIAAATLASTLADTLEADGDTMSALEVQAQTNASLTAIDVQARAVANYSTEASYALGRALLALAASLGDLATLVISSKPPLTTFVVGADISLLAWVHALYQDSTRVGEVLALNSIADPLLIPAGTTLRAYAV